MIIPLIITILCFLMVCFCLIDKIASSKKKRVYFVGKERAKEIDNFYLINTEKRIYEQKFLHYKNLKQGGKANEEKQE